MRDTFPQKGLTSGGSGAPKAALTDGDPSNSFTSAPIQIEQHSKIVIA